MNEKETVLLNTTTDELNKILSDKKPIHKIHGLPAREYRRLIRERERNTNPDYTPTVSEFRLQQEEKSQRETLTIHEWNRLQHEQPLIITNDQQIDAGCVLVFNARKAWRFMKDSRYSCISVRVVYKQRPAFLFRLKVKQDGLPW